MAATHRSASGIPVSGGRAVSRTPCPRDSERGSSERGTRLGGRRCKPPERNVPRRPGSPVLQSLNRRGRIDKSGTVPSNATCFSSRWTSGVGTACQPSATRWSRRQRSMRSRAGVLFANHWANAAPCGPSRACLYTGPISTRTGRCSTARRSTPASPTSRCSPAGHGVRPSPLRLHRHLGRPAHGPPLTTRGSSAYEGVLPGLDPVVLDPWEQGSPAWGRWLATQGVDVPVQSARPVRALAGYPGAESHGTSWAPARFPPELSQTSFVRQAVEGWLDDHGERPFFIHASFIRPHPPRRNPIGYHDLLRRRGDPAVHRVRAARGQAAIHPFGRDGHLLRAAGPPRTCASAASCARPTTALNGEVDDGLAQLFGYLDAPGCPGRPWWSVTSDHGEMGCDHWLVEKLGWWDESYHVPLIVVDPHPRRIVGGAVVDSGDRIGRHAPHHLRVHGRRHTPPGRWLAAQPVPPGRADPRTLAGHRSLRMELRRSGGPLRRTCSRAPHEPLLARGLHAAPGTSSSTSEPRPTCFRPCSSTSSLIPAGSRTSSRVRPGRLPRADAGLGMAPPPGRPPRSCCTGTCARRRGR